MMQEFGLKSTKSGLDAQGINVKEAHWNLSVPEIIEHCLANGEGVMTDTGAFACDTGKFTGRAPKDKFIVEDDITRDSCWWGEINQPIAPEKYEQIKQKMFAYLKDKQVYVRDAYAGADERYRLDLRVINTQAWQSFFCFNMFLRPSQEELKNFKPNFTVISIPEFKADPEEDGTYQENFAIVNFTENMILIGGTGYAGEIKKGIFSVLNFTLPKNHQVLSMHCSANVGEKGDTAIFFGLSGTGKTTLSADPKRALVGDDEHGWTDDNVFNFEGGCYAKVIDLSKEKEPQIWDAIKFGAIVENTRFHKGTRIPDYENRTVTENTRTSYPIYHIDNALDVSLADTPKNIFFLTADAFGVIPPISKLSPGQAMYHFISGYTAKVAGTEMGIEEPETTFSACFGAAFLPLHPTEYAEILGKKMKEQNVNVWLVNTGWTGGPYGVGSRMKLPYTRAMITAALNGELHQVEYEKHSIFGVEMPKTCPNVPAEVLNPRNTWTDKDAYDTKANDLANEFIKNFEEYAKYANEEIMAGAPESESSVDV